MTQPQAWLGEFESALSASAPALPPARERIPTNPFDLSEYAFLGALPDGDDELEFTAGPLLDVGPKDIPRLAGPLSQLDAHDPRETFLLSRIDGKATVDVVLDIAGMPRDEAFAMLCDLMARGLVAFDAPA
jgi:hypothetical protein